jgi:ATP-dependent Clp protease ATP-binding subunit ClpB
MNNDKISERLQTVLMNAVNSAQSRQHPSVDTIDVLEAIFKDDILNGLFERVNVDKQRALSIIEEENRHISRASSSQLNLSNEVQKSLEKAQQWAANHQEIYLSVASVWLALMFNGSYISKRLVKEFNLNEEASNLAIAIAKFYLDKREDDLAKKYLDEGVEIFKKMGKLQN